MITENISTSSSVSEQKIKKKSDSKKIPKNEIKIEQKQERKKRRFRPVPLKSDPVNVSLRNEFWSLSDDALISAGMFAAVMGVSRTWIYDKCRLPGWPQRYDFGKNHRYRKYDIVVWIKEHQIQVGKD